ncbi:MAG: Glutamyl-tRNA(Gln) amidotransferase subunit E [Promethearchaeota archaeon]|nr:MAG: Glutamyl-tRNA(Gln) amidotransferase subunit E [Candidatus Lokiarchaeota archaeon]
MTHDYEKLGLKCGLEIHQQLDSATKLFCRCPNELQGTREPDFIISRKMRPVLGEMGTYDQAMLTEYEKDTDIKYECYNDVICTYEMDETPPFSCNEEAKIIALQIALLLKMNIIEEMHVCRKNYLDGSVPCGFQRTMILAKDGLIELENGKKVGIDILCLEEDAARKTKTEVKTNFFRLDRLGIPLIEVTTKPDINDPVECRECAERLGLLLWSANVKKILGSIRQDVNVSIKGGTRIEIKGVQKLDWIPVLINNEISRQMNLIKIKEELESRELTFEDVPKEPLDLTEDLSDTKCNFIMKGIKSGKKLYGLKFGGFKGIFGKELMEDYRFGTEVSSKMKSISGLKGLIHSDENLESYSFSDEDVKSIRNKLKISDDDAFVLLLGGEKELKKAIKVIITRVRQAFSGVPPETRRALEDGGTEFLRELHGGARLYPDTDTPAILNRPEEIEDVSKTIPDYPWNIIETYSKQFDVERRIIKDLIFEGRLDLFEDLYKIYSENPILIITTLLETTKALKRDGKEVEHIKAKDYKKMFQMLENEKIGKEAIEDIMEKKAEHPNLSIKEIKEKLNLEQLSLDDLREMIDSIIEKNSNLIEERGMGAMGALMGDIMGEVKGKIDGSVVSKEMKQAVQEKIKELK